MADARPNIIFRPKQLAALSALPVTNAGWATEALLGVLLRVDVAGVDPTGTTTVTEDAPAGHFSHGAIDVDVNVYTESELVVKYDVLPPMIVEYVRGQTDVVV